MKLFLRYMDIFQLSITKQNLAEIFELQNYTAQRMALCRDFPPPPPLIPLFYPNSTNAIQECHH